jgi:SAM-dependent methyltransferase
MRDWRAYWSNRPSLTSGNADAAMVQVGKTVLGAAVEPKHVEYIITAILDALEPEAGDVLIDLGCGNGLLAARLAAQALSVCGFDVSEVLVADARRYRSVPGCHYERADITCHEWLERIPAKACRFYAYEVLQHLSTEETRTLLKNIRESFADCRFFAGGIPDRERLRAFYNTEERWRLYTVNAARDDDQMGHWWKPGEFEELATGLGFYCQVRAQNPALYTAHYRFDALLTTTP